MNIEKFTERSRGFLQAAQTIAIRDFHQQLTPQHLLKALLDDEEGAAASLIRAAGGEPAIVKTTVEHSLDSMPKVQGDGAGQPQAMPELVRVLEGAEKEATKAGDEYVAQDRLLWLYLKHQLVRPFKKGGLQLKIWQERLILFGKVVRLTARMRRLPLMR